MKEINENELENISGGAYRSAADCVCYVAKGDREGVSPSCSNCIWHSRVIVGGKVAEKCEKREKGEI